MTHHGDLLNPPVRLPEDPAVARLDAGDDPASVAAAFPTSSAAWAALARAALDNGRAIEGYAYARTGYHRGLDSLRKAGWRGQGRVPWAHEPNRGVLTAFWLLARAAGEIGETDEVERLNHLLADSDPEAAAALS
ncbi:DUF3151 domain-containing protein [Jatrophihabitans fulvus]